MADVKRITPEEVVEAYRKTGLTMSRRCYFDRTKASVCACGIGAYSVAYLGVDPMKYYAANDAIARMYDAGFKTMYSEGFIDGFDGDEVAKARPHYNAAQYETGYADGAAAYVAAKEAAND